MWLLIFQHGSFICQSSFGICSSITNHYELAVLEPCAQTEQLFFDFQRLFNGNHRFAGFPSVRLMVAVPWAQIAATLPFRTEGVALLGSCD